jgi:hypothetical protein
MASLKIEAKSISKNEWEFQKIGAVYWLVVPDTKFQLLPPSAISPPPDVACSSAPRFRSPNPAAVTPRVIHWVTKCNLFPLFFALSIDVIRRGTGFWNTQ